MRWWLNILLDDAARERSEPLRGHYFLRSATRVLNIIGEGRHAETAVRSSYRSTASGGILSSDGLLQAECWLVEQGWLTRDGDTLRASARCRELPDDEVEAARELARAIILDSPPTWLRVVAARGEIRPELLPAQVERTLDDMFSLEERDAILLAAALKHDEESRRALGAAGEEAVVAACRELLELHSHPDLARSVRRVSLISDALGYDIAAPDLQGRECRLEVKCYGGRFPNFYITRNEFEVGLKLPRWNLVLCRSSGDSTPEVIGWMGLGTLRHRMPSDTYTSATWQVARVRIDESELRPGLPMSPADSSLV